MEQVAIALGVLDMMLAAWIAAWILRVTRPRAATAAAELAAAAPEWFEAVLRKQVVIHTKDDQSIEGSLMSRTDDGVILRAAKLLGDNGRATTMAGEVFVPRENIAFAQLDE